MGAKSIQGAEQKADNIINSARQEEKSILLEAKDKAIKIIDEAKAEEKQRREDLKVTQDRLEKRESTFDQKILELENKQVKITEKTKELEEAKEKIALTQEEQIKKLETISGFTRDKAEEVLLKHAEKVYKESLISRMKKLEEENSLELEKRAKDKLAQVVARIAVSHASEITTTAVELPSDEMKGRIIGKEGRNIRALEHLTGCELIVDDTPNIITVITIIA